MDQYFGYIYKTTCLVNGKIYIGQCTKMIESSKEYLGSGSKILLAIKKYGKDNFSKEILKICKNQISINAYEILFIKEYDSCNPAIGYNLLKGPSCGLFSNLSAGINHPNTGRINHTPESKEELSKRWTGEANPNYGKSAFGLDNNFYGKKHTNETKKKISDLLMTDLHPCRGKKGELSHMFNRKLPDITKEKIGEKALNFWQYRKQIIDKENEIRKSEGKVILSYSTRSTLIENGKAIEKPYSVKRNTIKVGTEN